MTSRIGCAAAKSDSNDYWVCHYASGTGAKLSKPKDQRDNCRQHVGEHGAAFSRKFKQFPPADQGFTLCHHMGGMCGSNKQVVNEGQHPPGPDPTDPRYSGQKPIKGGGEDTEGVDGKADVNPGRVAVPEPDAEAFTGDPALDDYDASAVYICSCCMLCPASCGTATRGDSVCTGVGRAGCDSLSTTSWTRAMSTRWGDRCQRVAKGERQRGSCRESDIASSIPAVDATRPRPYSAHSTTMRC